MTNQHAMNGKSAVIMIFLAASLVGCSSGSHTSSPQPTETSLTPLAASLVNGRVIFQTGRDSEGTQIGAQHRPLYSSCAACHGASGSGAIRLPGGAISADLRYKALVSDQKRPYTIALLERAISTGIDGDGRPLSPVMPRWKLSKRDLHDVANYVLTQLK
ncbi:MAG: cytochrome c [Candidatus Eremiobacteraeota bacterium]|nr:cytochrome c [Candidatus Eremiobacteraeota bacterium]